MSVMNLGEGKFSHASHLDRNLLKLIINQLTMQLIYIVETIGDVYCGLEVETAQCAGKTV